MRENSLSEQENPLVGYDSGIELENPVLQLNLNDAIDILPANSEEQKVQTVMKNLRIIQILLL